MISENDKAYLFLSAMEVSYKKFSDILSHYGSAGDVLSAITSGDEFLKSQFDNFYEIQEKLDNFSFVNLEKYFETSNSSFLTIESEKYPEKLLNLDQPPLILYYKGDINLLNTKGFAIVGTRKPSYYGKDVTSQFAKGLCENGFTIVSGLALGVDKVAHETTLKNNGKTIAVLGCGLERMYPELNIELSKQIAKNGLLLTEYHPTFKACNYSFPARNRIIAGLSVGVLISEAPAKSGALYTKDFALELGRDVFSVPGNVNSINSVGTNSIIKSGHAQMVTCVEDVLLYYGIDKKVRTKKKVLELNFEEQNIYNILQQNGEMFFDDLQILTKMNSQNLISCLTTMEIRGIIKKLQGNYYAV